VASTFSGEGEGLRWSTRGTNPGRRDPHRERSALVTPPLRDKRWRLFETLTDLRQPLDLGLEGANAFLAAAMPASGSDQAARRTQRDHLRRKRVCLVHGWQDRRLGITSLRASRPQLSSKRATQMPSKMGIKRGHAAFRG